MQPLKPYTANTAISVLDPSGLVPELANSFLPKNTDTREGMKAYSETDAAHCKSQKSTNCCRRPTKIICAGVESLKLLSRRQIQEHVQETLASICSSDILQGPVQASSNLPPIDAAPRRLSFSGKSDLQI